MFGNDKIKIRHRVKESKEQAISSILTKLEGLCDNKTASRSTRGSIIVTLHNEEIRPTRYEVCINHSPFGNVISADIKTIINKTNGKHEQATEHMNIANGEPDLEKLSERINNLIAQEANGSVEETLKRFIPVGLLFLSY
ncbi:hypothetical protein VCHA53O466_140115 [Vibrio chagasii]|nr:hypothetical protein VCHA53O466_140115 [Vibrio chagasii]